jgi:PhzF family phenazine biosynthesis protein
MKVKIFQVDAFTSEIFGGNPACVCVLDEWLSDNLLQKIAEENAVAETAYLVQENKHIFQIRWFTPEIEMDLCGHATLAASHVIFHHLNIQTNSGIIFKSNTDTLTVSRREDLIELNFPSRPPSKSELPSIIRQSLNIQPLEVWKSRDYMLVYESESQIKSIKPDETLLQKINLDPGGIIVTAKGDEVDFVSRFFTPQAGIFEDPVTGSAHCTLIPFWSERLGLEHLKALQISKRGGELFCINQDSRVLIAGKAQTYLIGEIYFNNHF